MGKVGGFKVLGSRFKKFNGSRQRLRRDFINGDAHDIYYLASLLPCHWLLITKMPAAGIATIYSTARAM